MEEKPVSPEEIRPLPPGCLKECLLNILVWLFLAFLVLGPWILAKFGVALQNYHEFSLPLLPK
jgi:hypothetical protein